MRSISSMVYFHL